MSLLLVLFALVFVRVEGLDNGLARTPPMGWMSWQRFRCLTNCKLYPDDCISEKLFRKMADLMASEGYLEAGYEYLVVDDCWLSKERDANGRLQADPHRFPSGMKNLSDYVHSKGLKFGMYEDYGTKTCKGYPGIVGHLEEDANTFAEWEVDYIKIDRCCWFEFKEMEQGYIDFGKYLNKTGRPMVYSCNWPSYFEPKGLKANYTLLSEKCNLWRNYYDIQDSHQSMTTILKWFIENQNRFARFAGPGHWNDPDMLVIGNYGLSYEQSKAQMAIWAIMAAPLFISADFRTITPEYKEILLNKDVIAINQDVLGIQGLFVKKIQDIYIWTRPITPFVGNASSYAVAFHSIKENGYPYALKVTLEEIGLNNPKGYYVNDVYEPKDEPEIVQIKHTFIARVKPSGVVLLKAIPV